MSDAPQPYIGGQAVIEGVMMRAPSCLSIAVRRPDGTIAVREGPLRAKLLTSGWSKIPGIRGMVTLVESLSLGYGALRFSAEQQMSEDERKEAADGGAAMWLSILFAIGLFMLLPQGMASGLGRLLGTSWDLTSFAFHAVTGGFKLLVFTLYISVIGTIPDVRRVFQYHGAEHKTIFAYESGLALTVDNVRQQPRLHPRCGTTFLIVVIAVSIVVNAVAIPVLLPNARGVVGWLLTAVLRIGLLPLVAAISYELQRLSARFCTTGPLRALLWPGFLFQKITTREPDDKQLEVAIAAMEVARVRDEAEAKLVASEPDRLHVFDSFQGVREAVVRGFSPAPAE